MILVAWRVVPNSPQRVFSRLASCSVENSDFYRNDVSGQVYMNLSASSYLEMIRQLLESNLGIGKLKIGIFG